MFLHEYLFKNKIKRKDFAARINFTEQTLFNYIHKRFCPSDKLAQAIEIGTFGAVTKKEVYEYFNEGKNVKESHKTRGREKKETSSSQQTFFCKDCMKKLLIIAANS